MMPRVFVALTFAVAMVSHADIAGACDDAAAFQRGVGVHRPLNWASVSPLDPTFYTWPPFATPEHQVADALIERVRADGFDFVRLTVDPGPFLQMARDRRHELDAILLGAIRRFRSHGLGVLLNFHGNSHVAAYRPEAVFSRRDAPLFASYVAVIAHAAHLLEGLNDPAVALEPVNEPPAGYDDATAAEWQIMMEALYRAARREAPRLLIVVTGAQGGSRHGLLRLDPAPFRDGNVLYSFHYYEPHVLTHQGVVSDESQTQGWRYVQALPYPTSAGDQQGSFASAQRRIADDAALAPADQNRMSKVVQRDIDEYFQGKWGAGAIDAAFDEVAAWASGHGIDPHRILLGEFGATRSTAVSPAQDRFRAAWLRDVRCAAEQRRFRWSIWELNGSGGMAIVDSGDPNGLDRTTLGALGLGPVSAMRQDCAS